MLLIDLLEQLTELYKKVPNASVVIEDRDGRESAIDGVSESNGCAYISMDRSLSI